ncbi:MAG: hypothetical protein ACHQRM_04150 [Bacteroidia bacterium]
MHTRFLIYFLILYAGSLSAQTNVLRIDSALEAPFFRSELTCFPNWVVRNNKGKLMNVTTQKKIKSRDTLSLKAPASSLLMRYENKEDGIYPDTILSFSSRVMMNADTLWLLCAFQNSPSEEILGITVYPELHASVLDGPPKKKELVGQRVLCRRVTLNQAHYKKGDLLKAELDFSIEYDLNDVAKGPYRQKVYYRGWMKCKVE